MSLIRKTPSIRLFLQADKKQFNKFLLEQYSVNMKFQKQKTELSNLEHAWGQEILIKYCQAGLCRSAKPNTRQWTNSVGECIVYELLKAKYGDVWKPKKLKDDNGFVQPDWETTDFIFEVKTRTYNTSGTIGEKVLGAPLKYCNVPVLYGKPLKIILVGFQEQEYKKLLFEEKMPASRRKILDFFEREQISFVKASSLLEN